jgi:23S rRNA pseudouridine1911/1915/1917 synthase
VNANRQSLSTQLRILEERILYADNHLLVVSKPSGWLSQGDGSDAPVLLDVAKAWVKRRYAKPGAVYLGLVHRLDRPVSGIMILARTSKAAARLSAQFRERTVEKEYWALLEGELPPEGELHGRLLRDASRGRVAEAPEGKAAGLSFHRLGYLADVSWALIRLHTGRRHQIRAQLAAHGYPIVGDKAYGSTKSYAKGAIALHARALVIEHPVTRERRRFEAEPEKSWPKHFHMSD